MPKCWNWPNVGIVQVFQESVASSTRKSLQWLIENSFITWEKGPQSYCPLPLGKATSAGSLRPQQALIVQRVCRNPPSPSPNSALITFPPLTFIPAPRIPQLHIIFPPSPSLSLLSHPPLILTPHVTLPSYPLTFNMQIPFPPPPPPPWSPPPPLLSPIMLDFSVFTATRDQMPYSGRRRRI